MWEELPDIGPVPAGAAAPSPGSSIRMPIRGAGETVVSDGANEDIEAGIDRDLTEVPATCIEHSHHRRIRVTPRGVALAAVQGDVGR